MDHQSATLTRIVINADDMGYAPERDRGILDAVGNGICSSASILANGLSAEGALRGWKEMEREWKKPRSLTPSLGIHINFTEGSPISEPKEIPSLLDSKSHEFLGKFGFGEAVRTKKVDLKHVEIELEAQLKWFQKHVGRAPSHADGHNHAHVYPGVAQIVAKVCAKWDIHWIRCPYEDFPVGTSDNKQNNFCRNIALHAQNASKVFRNNKLRVVSHFYGMQISGKDLTVSNIQKIIAKASRTEGQVVEIMTHPGYPSKTGDEFSRSGDRLHELKVLTNESLVAAARKANVGPFISKLQPCPNLVNSLDNIEVQGRIIGA
uniref:Carbohydrate deacetylase n=1 Tax=Amorphochlora amoebiformis TaxID=1561963 RepID=A0A7S0H836_9EUKA|mmetsp:Transcript_4833/g.7380  ORF Transcript_4833/g.7380 Transcript_4833/m.7380 type:complete len:320 (+) Transcript_4833:70-1029(+)